MPSLRDLANLVRFEHTIFALPFAFTSLLLANPVGGWPSLWTLLWVLLAMTGGRTFAMGLNRIADAKIDALNPRTANREIPAGKVSMSQAWMLTLTSMSLMVLAVFQLPLICQQLLPVALVILALYSYMKRFSSLCHLVLGIALGSSAIGGWLAQTGEWNGGLPIWLGLGVALWVMGFDVIYACQDTEFDQAQGLHSIPAKLGNAVALHLSRWMHAGSVLSLLYFILMYISTPGFGMIGLGFVVATLLMAILLVWEHRLVSANDLTRVNMAFFTLNGQISMGFFIFVLIDRLALWLSPAYALFSQQVFDSLHLSPL
jgi:4-hydroxybenzoate polyprenyltransferase